MSLIQNVTCKAIEPALAMLPRKMDSPEARVLVLAIGMQESEFLTRVQMGGGPAHSYWQLERGGGVLGVLTHKDSKQLAEQLCAIRGVVPTPSEVWEAMEFDDVLGAGFARLLLWTDAQKLPAIDDAKGGWEYYLRNWRPGKPHPDKWLGNHARARLHAAMDSPL